MLSTARSWLLFYFRRAYCPFCAERSESEPSPRGTRLQSHTGCVIQDLKRAVAALERRIRRLRREAMTLVREDDLLRKRYELLISIPGIAQVSAMQLLVELSTLPVRPYRKGMGRPQRP
jgi:transposase